MITKRQIKKRKDVKNKTLHHKKLMKEANTQTGMMIRQEKKQQKFNLNETRILLKYRCYIIDSF